MFFCFSFLLISARGVTETTPSFMYPYGTSSSQMVLRGVDLLLECIASGVYVPGTGAGGHQQPQCSYSSNAESPLETLLATRRERSLFY